MKPYPVISKLLLLAFGCIVFSIYSCGLQNDINKLNFKKPIASADTAADTLARGVARNLMLGIDDKSQIVIKHLLSSLKGSVDTLNPDIKKLMHAINLIGDTTSLQLTKVGDNLNWQIGRLKGTVSSFNGTINSLAGTLNKATKNLLSDMIQTALDSLKAPSSKAKVDSIVSTMLDKNTDVKVQKLVNTALQPTIDSIANKIDLIVHKDVPFVQKQATLLLTILGIVALAIIGFVWYERSKYARLVKVLTYQIDKMPKENVDAYNDLTQKIKAHAQNEDLEPLLSKVLIAQGIN